MIFCDRVVEEKKKEALNEKLNQIAFFTFSGGALGAIFGGSYGLAKGIPLNKIIPRTIFKSSAFFASILAIQGALEIGRNQDDYLNPLIAGGWTGFIFGHGLTKRLGLGLVLGLNTAIFTLAVHSFTLPKFMEYLRKSGESLNPILLDENTRPLTEKIDHLQRELDLLKQPKKE